MYVRTLFHSKILKVTKVLQGILLNNVLQALMNI